MQYVEHNGGLPGFLTELLFFPNDNIAVVAFANSEGTGITQTDVALRVVEDYLGLKHSVELPSSGALKVEHSELLPSFSSQNSPKSNIQQQCDDLSKHARPAVPLEHYEGTYANPGYGNLTFCAASSKDSSCAQVLFDFTSISPNGTLDPNSLYVGTSRMIADHVRLRRACSTSSFGVESFRLSAGTIFPNGYGQDTTPFMYSLLPGELDAECLVEGDPAQVVGCGIMNVEAAPPRTEGSVQERADVWFTKV